MAYLKPTNDIGTCWDCNEESELYTLKRQGGYEGKELFCQECAKKRVKKFIHRQLLTS